jgi:group I intron endonuclease
MTGIYSITNIINNKKYIGQSINLERRLCRHIGELIKCSHSNTHLQASFLKYGIQNFEFEIITICDKSMLNELEIYYIDLFNSHNNKYGFNKTYGGDTPNHNLETREKISEKQKGRKLTPEWRNNVIEALKGRPVSEDTRKKIGDKNRKFSEDELKNIVDLYINQGYSQKEIAKITNSGKMTINRYLKQYKEKMKYDLNNKIICMLNKGIMQKEIANQLNVSESKISQVKKHM